MILIPKLKDISNEEIELIINSNFDYYIKISNGKIIETNDVDERDYYVERQILNYAICTSDTDLIEEAEKRNIKKNNNENDFNLN